MNINEQKEILNNICPLYKAIRSKREVTKIFNLLYNNSNFYMARKFNKFNYYVNTEVSQLLIDHRNA